MTEDASLPRDPKRELDAIDRAFKALAHPLRRQVLLVLHFRGGEMSSGAIAGRFHCKWPTTTRHLRLLEDAGLVRSFQRGRERFYRLDKPRLDRLVGGWLQWFDQPPAVAPEGGELEAPSSSDRLGKL